MRIETPADLTAEWLAEQLGQGVVTDFEYQRIGTGQMSECYRVILRYGAEAAGPSSVVLKVAASDPTSRQTGLALGLYGREVRFYTDIAPRISGPIPTCYHAAIDEQTGIFDLLLEDAAPATVGDEIRGATIEQALLAVTELGRLHRSVRAATGLADVDWLNRESPVNQGLLAQLYAAFGDRFADRLTEEQRTICQRLVDGFDGYLAAEAQRPHSLVHGDYRLDNMLFGQDGARPLTVVDWQTVTWAPDFTDLAYFLGCALPIDVRRQHFAELVDAYLEGLGPEAGIIDVDVRDGIRRQSFFGVMMAIVSSMLVERTERGDAMFMAMLERHCAQVMDTDALAVLPTGTPKPLQPSASDELAHPAGEEPLWNESWYFDFLDPVRQLGGWIRLGLYPNQDKAWVNALLCGPNRPTIAVNDFEVAVPTDPRVVHTADFEFDHGANADLQEYRVTLRGRGQAHDDPADLLRAVPGRPVEVSLELVWRSAGVPYQYRLATRYEIPCTVSGTVVAEGISYALEDVPGQRDHSWGERDWWSMDWVWSALHLSDGTHLHGVDIRIPGAPPIGAGYVQQDAEVVELTAVQAQASFADNDLPLTTQLRMLPGELIATAEILGHAPVRLVADDGRVAQFPRAWARITMADGRTGVGWLEWNRNR